MIKKILMAAALVISMLSAEAQQMKEVFINMPDSLSPLLTKVNKADFADFLESGMKAQVKNKFDKISEMKTLTDDYLFLQTTSRSSLEMKLLPLNDSTKVVCAVKTVCAPVCDSYIYFYTLDWKKLPASSHLILPAVEEFYVTDSISTSEERKAILNKADMTLMKMSLSPDGRTLSVVYTTPEYLDEDSYKEIEPFLKKDTITYKWQEGKFVK